MTTKNTEHGIMLAIARIVHGRQKHVSKDRKLSIAAVAEEAEISNATIHNRYPELAEHIKDLQKRTSKSTLASNKVEIADLHRQISELRKAFHEKEAEVHTIAMVNLRMAQEMKELQTVVQNLQHTKGNVRVIGRGNDKQ